jgi:hypothetical protein
VTCLDWIYSSNRISNKHRRIRTERTFNEYIIRYHYNSTHVFKHLCITRLLLVFYSHNYVSKRREFLSFDYSVLPSRNRQTASRIFHPLSDGNAAGLSRRCRENECEKIDSTEGNYCTLLPPVPPPRILIQCQTERAASLALHVHSYGGSHPVFGFGSIHLQDKQWDAII